MGELAIPRAVRRSANLPVLRLLVVWLSLLATVPFSIAGAAEDDQRFASVVRQKFDFSCGSAALATLLKFHLLDQVDEDQILEALRTDDPDSSDGKAERMGFSLGALARVARKRGHFAGTAKLTVEQFRVAVQRSPLITRITYRGFEHMTVVRTLVGDRVYLADPAFGNVTVTMVEFVEMWAGERPFGYVLLVWDAKTTGDQFQQSPLIQQPTQKIPTLSAALAREGALQWRPGEAIADIAVERSRHSTRLPTGGGEARLLQRTTTTTVGVQYGVTESTAIQTTISRQNAHVLVGEGQVSGHVDMLSLGAHRRLGAITDDGPWLFGNIRLDVLRDQRALGAGLTALWNAGSDMYVHAGAGYTSFHNTRAADDDNLVSKGRFDARFGLVVPVSAKLVVSGSATVSKDRLSGSRPDQVITMGVGFGAGQGISIQPTISTSRGNGRGVTAGIGLTFQLSGK